jgi:hypothetical protein
MTLGTALIVLGLVAFAGYLTVVVVVMAVLVQASRIEDEAEAEEARRQWRAALEAKRRRDRCRAGAVQRRA